MNRFVCRLHRRVQLTKADEETLNNLTKVVRRVAVRSDLRQTDAPRFLPLLIEGWACRHKQLENGKRQIISLLLPGDLCEPFGASSYFPDHSIAAITPVAFALIAPDTIRAAAHASPRIEEALWLDLLVAAAIDREHVVSLGRRSGVERLGHLFCELHLRLEAVGLVNEMGYEMPITQVDLADLLGLSGVHVNRSLQDLRSAGLISLRGRRLTIHNLEELRAASFFDPAYLYLTGPALS